MSSLSSSPAYDSSETVYISSLALLKMLKHGRAGVPLEVMGLMLGEFVDEYTINVVDVFACPQYGTDTSVETADEQFQADMIQLLKQTERKENVVGWYHSHPGFGCWFSQTDISTQSMFEKQNKRCVGVVIDTIQSVKGHIVIEAFRMASGGDPFSMLFGFSSSGSGNPAVMTANRGHVKKLTAQQLKERVGSLYYALPIKWKLEEPDEKVLKRIHREEWLKGLVCKDYHQNDQDTFSLLGTLNKEIVNFRKSIEEDDSFSDQQEDKSKDNNKTETGVINYKIHLNNDTSELLESTINQSLNTAINAEAF